MYAYRSVKICIFGCIAILALSLGWMITSVVQAEVPCTEWSLATDFKRFPDQLNPNPDSCGNPNVWQFLRADLNSQVYTLLDYFDPAIQGIANLQQWAKGAVTNELPAIGINATGGDIYLDAGFWPSGIINVHPLYDEQVVVGWQSPIDGEIAVSGSVSDHNNGGGDGISWSINRNSTNLASGEINNGGAQDFQTGTGGYRLGNISVHSGDYLYVAIHPKWDYTYDGTGLDLTIQAVNVPYNDNFANAHEIQNLPFGDFRDITSATVEVDEPMPTCTSPAGYQTLWYRFTPAFDGLLSVNTEYPNTTSFTAIWAGSVLTSLDEVGCQVATPMQATLQAGVTYMIQVGSQYPGASGDADIWMSYASPPANDQRATATLITSMPFVDHPDLSYATAGADDPSSCATYGGQGKTVWYRITPAEDMAIESDLFDNWSDQFAFSVFEEVDSSLHPIGCWQNLDPPIALRFSAGNTYYFMIDAYPDQAELVGFEVTERILAPNDAFASAAALSLPTSTWQDISGASFEENEPIPSCANDVTRSVWYTFTADSNGTLTANKNSWGSSQFFAVYHGSSISDLTPIACTTGNDRLWFSAEPGMTYFLQLGSMNALLDWQGYGYYDFMDFSVHWAQVPSADFYYSPSDPTIFDNLSFWDNLYDPEWIGFSSYEWDFGDGATSTELNPTHRYSQDGDFQVRFKATTVDGRVAEVTKVLQVRTHDVTITKFQVPKSAAAGQTRTITVGLQNLRYPEMVEIHLYKSTPGGWAEIGVLVQYTPIRSGNRTTDFLFSYTFTPDDAKEGKVIFKAIANIQGFRDALSADNEAISQPVKVGR